MIAPDAVLSPGRERDRRREVKRRLAESGFRRGPHRLAGDPAATGAPAPDESCDSERLAALLRRLGGLFPGFGVYLSSRADLLILGERGELARLADAEPASPAAVRALLAAELGRPPAELFAMLDPTPFASRLAVQAHRARLRSGEPAVVELVHPELAGWMATDLEILPLLAGAFSARPAFPLLEAIADFREELERAADLAATAAALETLADDVDTLRGATGGAAPRVFRALTRGRVLAYERLDGWTLAAPAASPAPVDELRPLAQRLCAVWLGQVLLGRTFPVEPATALALAGGGIAFGGGPYERPSPAFQAHLSRYLAAAAGDDADEVSAALLPELARAAAGPPGDEPLRLRLRRAASGDGLAEQLLLHWRAAREEGYRASPPLLAFYRGLLAVAAAARRLDPAGDPLSAGLAEVRLLAGFAELRTLLSRAGASEAFERYGALMLDMPQRLDGALTALAARREDPTAEAGEGGPGSPWAFPLAAALALAAIALATRPLAGLFAAAAGPWIERAGAGAFLLVGGLLVRGALGRRAP